MTEVGPGNLVLAQEAKFETKPVRDSKNPAWNHTGELQMSHSALPRCGSLQQSEAPPKLMLETSAGLAG